MDKSYKQNIEQCWQIPAKRLEKSVSSLPTNNNNNNNQNSMTSNFHLDDQEWSLSDVWLWWKEYASLWPGIISCYVSCHFRYTTWLEQVIPGEWEYNDCLSVGGWVVGKWLVVDGPIWFECKEVHCCVLSLDEGQCLHMVHGRSLSLPGLHDTVVGGVGHVDGWWFHRWPHSDVVEIPLCSYQQWSGK